MKRIAALADNFIFRGGGAGSPRSDGVPTTVKVIRPGLEHVGQLVSVAVETMSDNPVYRAIFPDDSTRAADLATMQRDALTYLIQMKTGLVWATEDLDGFAVVYRIPLPFRTEPGGPVFIDSGARDRWARLAAEQQRRYPMPPGLLLSAVCVAPESQRSGRGTALLEQVHALADFHAVAVTTGTAAVTAVPWLTRSGYAIRADLVDLEHGPRFWCLERPRM